MENRKMVIIVITVLSLLVVGLGGYLVYDKFISNEPSEKKDNKNEDNSLSYEDAMIIGEANLKIEKYNLYALDKLEKKVDDLNKLDNQFKLEISLSYLMNNDFGSVRNCDSESGGYDIVYNAVALENYFTNVFADTITFKNENTFYCGYHWHMIYNKEDKSYSDSGEGHGGHGVYALYTKLVKYEVKDSKYILTYNKAFTSTSDGGSSGHIYDRYSVAYNSDNKAALFQLPESIYFGESKTEINKYIEEKIEKEGYKLNEYIYTFVMDDVDGLKLVSYEFKENK